MFVLEEEEEINVAQAKLSRRQHGKRYALNTNVLLASIPLYLFSFPLFNTPSLHFSRSYFRPTTSFPFLFIMYKVLVSLAIIMAACMATLVSAIPIPASFHAKRAAAAVDLASYEAANAAALASMQKAQNDAIAKQSAINAKQIAANKAQESKNAAAVQSQAYGGSSNTKKHSKPTATPTAASSAKATSTTSGKKSKSTSTSSSSSSSGSGSYKFSGDGTWYNPGMGSCGIENSATDLIAAMNVEQMANGGNPNSNKNCNRKVNIKGPNGTVTVTVTDTCPSCASGSIGMS